MVGCTIFAIGEAFFILEFLGARGASPSDKSWLNLDIASELVGILVKLLDEVEGTLVVRAVPDFDVGPFALLLDGKLCGKRGTTLFLCKLDEHFAISLTDEHRRDSDARSSSVITHDDIGHILDPMVNDNQ